MSTLVMVRTECCESYKHCGMRCSNCPSRPGNVETALNYKQQAATISAGRRGSLRQTQNANPTLVSNISATSHP